MDLTKLKKNEVIKDHPCRLRHKNGSIRHVRLDSSVRTELNGEFANTRCFLRDVTEQTLLEQEKQVRETSQYIYYIHCIQIFNSKQQEII